MSLTRGSWIVTEKNRNSDGQYATGSLSTGRSSGLRISPLFQSASNKPHQAHAHYLPNNVHNMYTCHVTFFLFTQASYWFLSYCTRSSRVTFTFQCYLQMQEHVCLYFSPNAKAGNTKNIGFLPGLISDVCALYIAAAKSLNESNVSMSQCKHDLYKMLQSNQA